VEHVARKTAHALNNYLMVFAGGLDIILGALERDPDRVRKMLGHMQEAAEGAGQLADRLQAMRGPDGSAPEVIDLREVVAGASAELRKVLGPDVELVLETSEEPALVCVDPTLMQRALEQLATNATEAMPGGGTLRIRVRKGHVAPEEARPDLPVGHYVMLDVEDTGKGMSPEVRAHVFHPFFTTTDDPDRGWGLTTIWGIVRQAQGTLWLDSVEKQGTTVTIHLPSAEVKPRPGARVHREEREVPPTGQTILLVDDESPVRALVTDVLVEAGYEVLPAANGDEALEIARHHRGGIHLLLADLIMPGLNGREVAEHFRGLRPGSKILFMSGFAADVLRKVSGGTPTPFLAKPFSPAQLRERVGEVLSQLAG
jgi:CheY-like chemotaxis protein